MKDKKNLPCDHVPVDICASSQVWSPDDLSEVKALRLLNTIHARYQSFKEYRVTIQHRVLQTHVASWWIIHHNHTPKLSCCIVPHQVSVMKLYFDAASATFSRDLETPRWRILMGCLITFPVTFFLASFTKPCTIFFLFNLAFCSGAFFILSLGWRRKWRSWDTRETFPITEWYIWSITEYWNKANLAGNCFFGIIFWHLWKRKQQVTRTQPSEAKDQTKWLTFYN